MAKSTITGTGIAWLAVALVVALGAVTWYVQGQQSDRTTALAKEVLALKKAGDGETAEKQLKSVAAQLKTISGSVSAMSSSMKALQASVKDLRGKVAKLEKATTATDIKNLNASVEAVRSDVSSLQTKVAGLEKMSKSNDTRNLRAQMAKTLADVKKAAANTARTNAAMIEIQKVVDRVSAQVKKLEAKGGEGNKEN
jgi:prefoldin subunit 5